jgi:hypothetical protein
VCERRRELLPQILHEWNRTDLQKHLSMDLRATTSRVAFANLKRRLSEECNFLAELAGIAPEEVSKLRRPRNLAAYFVLRDAAAIFAWFTDKKATRQVHRITNRETGPFFQFASALWPVVFSRGTQGLPAAMKNWEKAKTNWEKAMKNRKATMTRAGSDSDEDSGWPSALIANIDLRHPTWRYSSVTVPIPPCD